MPTPSMRQHPLEVGESAGCSDEISVLLPTKMNCSARGIAASLPELPCKSAQPTLLQLSNPGIKPPSTSILLLTLHNQIHNL